MPKNTTQCPWPGVEPGPFDLGTSALTMRPPRLHEVREVPIYTPRRPFTFHANLVLLVHHYVVLHQASVPVGGAVASWLVRSTPYRVVRVRALAGDIVLCSWARHFTLTVSLSLQVYKWVPANLMLGVTLRWTSIPSREE